MKKKTFIFIGICLIILIIYKIVNKPISINEAKRNYDKTRQNQYFIEKNTQSKYKLSKNNDLLHDGSVSYLVGAYKFEFAAIKKNQNDSLLVVYIDNMLNQPTYPNNTKLMIKHKDNNYDLKVIKNGLMIGYIPNYKLNESLLIDGIFAKKDLHFSFVIEKFSMEIK